MCSCHLACEQLRMGASARHLARQTTTNPRWARCALPRQVEALVESEEHLKSRETALRSNEAALKSALAQVRAAMQGPLHCVPSHGLHAAHMRARQAYLILHMLMFMLSGCKL